VTGEIEMARTPAEVFPPGEYIRDELDARGWAQADLAEILGSSLSNVSDILNGRRGISAETAKGLGDAFGTSAEVWLALDSKYRLASASAAPGTGLRARIYSKTPVRDLVRRHWIEGSRDPEVLASQVCEFLRIPSLADVPTPFAHAARKATSYADTSATQIAWLSRVAQLAPAAPITKRYSRTAFSELVQKLLALARSEPEIRRVPSLLAEHGIRFLIVEHLPQSRIDGACVWLDPASPVVALSLRYGRMDSFWHTLLHELAHVRRRDGQATVDSDLTFAEGALPGAELEASRFAVETLIPKDELAGFIERVGPVYSLKRIQGFAARLGVHPAIVIGQLAYRGEITWSRFGSSLPNVRDRITTTALTDGWGSHPRIPGVDEQRGA
jgi:HTH-type transcriptional regulator/antitoxin HigA